MGYKLKYVALAHGFGVLRIWIRLHWCHSIWNYWNNRWISNPDKVFVLFLGKEIRYQTLHRINKRICLKSVWSFIWVELIGSHFVHNRLIIALGKNYLFDIWLAIPHQENIEDNWYCVHTKRMADSVLTFCKCDSLWNNISGWKVHREILALLSFCEIVLLCMNELLLFLRVSSQ